ncbi:nuclease-related domain-containing protein [Bacillus sp. JJ1474]|uniref:nuclease-related domain-containing protein n=1 Tax=Bacillus sp. JJ1474 TaxID=3122955 RepID=UPI002FFE5B73
MLIKARVEPVELKVLRQLNVRSNLTETEQSYYCSLEKGFQGELLFDVLTEPLSTHWLILNDLMLEYNHAVFQIDTLYISSEKIIIFEAKNYEGDYFIKDDKWYTLSGVGIRNPLHQLERNESLLRGLLEEFGVTTPIEKYLIFINPEFYLYQAPLNLPIFFPTQLNRLKKQLSKNSINYKESHVNFAKRLASMHVKKSPYMRLPSYSYEELKKGITCVSCHSFNIEIRSTRLICKVCGCHEKLAEAALRGIEEFRFLFPDRKITISESMDWLKIDSRTTMRRLLSQNFKQMGRGRYSYYVEK